jgi:hypothetical protein
VIYFAQSTEGGPVKIGATDDVARRLGQLEAYYGKPLAVLATLPGGADEERAIHRRFDHLRLGRKEQFRPHAELMAFIRRPLLVGANPDAVEVMPGRFGSIAVYEDFAEKVKQASGERGITAAEFGERFLTPCAERAHRDYINAESKRLEGGKK